MSFKTKQKIHGKEEGWNRPPSKCNHCCKGSLSEGDLGDLMYWRDMCYLKLCAHVAEYMEESPPWKCHMQAIVLGAARQFEWLELFFAPSCFFCFKYVFINKLPGLCCYCVSVQLFVLRHKILDAPGSEHQPPHQEKKNYNTCAA